MSNKTKTSKPSYIGTLNAIANGERGGHALFNAWSGATKDTKLKPTLDMIALRELEHSVAFEKRLCELGFTLRAPSQPNKALNKHVKLLASKATDTEKFASFGIGAKKKDKTSSAPDGLLQLLADKTIDPQTGALLGRYICEERDSGVALTKAYRAAKRRK